MLGSASWTRSSHMPSNEPLFNPEVNSTLRSPMNSLLCAFIYPFMNSQWITCVLLFFDYELVCCICVLLFIVLPAYQYIDPAFLLWLFSALWIIPCLIHCYSLFSIKLFFIFHSSTAIVYLILWQHERTHCKCNICGGQNEEYIPANDVHHSKPTDWDS